MSLPSGNAKQQKAADPPKKNGMHHPKEKASVTNSDGYRQRADRPHPSIDPTAEKDSFHTGNNTAGQYPCSEGLHTLMSFCNSIKNPPVRYIVSDRRGKC